MKHNRKSELIACCEGIIRNAEKITENLEYDVNLSVEIVMYANETPNVVVKKEFMPKEVIEAWQNENE